jgi:hypothetical protein
MGWSGFPLSEGDDWARPAVLNQIVAAYNERARVIREVVWSGFVDLPEFAIGDDVQSRSTLLNLQSKVSKMADYFGCDPIPTESLSPVYPIFWQSDAQAVPYRRKYPRSVNYTSSPGSTGQRAWVGVAGYGKVHQYSGTAWVPSTDQTIPPDTLEAYGGVLAGDYIGPWILNDLYSSLNNYHSLLHQVFVESVVSGYQWSSDGYFDTREAAVASATSNQTAFVPSAYRDSAPLVVSSVSQRSLTPQWSAGATRLTRIFTPTISSYRPAFARLWMHINTQHGEVYYPFESHGDAVTLGWMKFHDGPISPGTPFKPNTVDTSVVPSFSSETGVRGWGSGLSTYSHPYWGPIVAFGVTYTFEYSDGLPGGGLSGA